MKKLKQQLTDTEKKENCFNVIYEESNITIPEIDDTDLLNFGMAFLKIRARELNKNAKNSVKN